MAYNLKLLKEFSLETRVLHEVAKIFWGDYVSIFPDEELYPFPKETEELDPLPKETEKLIHHRQDAIHRFSGISLFPSEILGQELVRAVIRLQRGYSDVLVCVQMHNNKNRFVLHRIHPLRPGPYSAKNFIDPSGYFNELFWAKSFISDESNSLYSRFELACFYCLEDVITDLWLSIQDYGRHPYDVTFNDIWQKFNYFVALWVARIDNKLEGLMTENENLAPGFYVSGFKYAKSVGNEYAARFFWDGCSHTEKSAWMRDMDSLDYEDLSNIAYMNHAGCVNFIYSLLSLENKIKHFSYYNVLQNDEYHTWTCLLLSPFYESALNDILTTHFPFSNYTFTLLLQRLTSKMREFLLLDYGKIFKSLWKSLSLRRQIEILEMDSIIIGNLKEIRAIGLLEIIIQPLPPVEKERMLIDDWQLAGISTLDSISNEGDFDALHRYFLLFLIDQDPVTQKLSMRGDASDFLNKFVSGEAFTQWIEGEIPERERTGVNKVIDSLQGSLNVLNSLLNQVEEIQSLSN